MSNLARKSQRDRDRQAEKEQRKKAKDKARRNPPLEKPIAGPNRKERREFRFKRGKWSDWED